MEAGSVIEKRKDYLKKKLFGWVKDNYDITFLIVLAVAFIIRIWIFMITKDQAMWFDAAEYMSTAKHWAGIGNMSDIWYYRRGFFWPLMGALFFKVGLGDTSIRFLTVLLSTGIVAVSYFLIKEMFNKKYALYSSIGLTFSWVILFFTGRPMTSIPATFFLLLSLLFFWKGYVHKKGNKYIYLFAIFLAISVLVRMQFLMLIPVFFAFIFVKEKFAFLKNKSLWIALLIFALIMFPLAILYNQHFGNPAADIISYYLGIEKGEALAGSTHSLKDIPMYLYDLPYNLTGYHSIISLTGVILILFIVGSLYFFADLFLGIDKIFSNKALQKKLFVFLWIFFPLLFLGYMGGYPQQRYTLAQHPFFFLIAAMPLFAAGRIIKKHLKFNKKVIALLIMLVFVVALLPNLSWANQLTKDKKLSYYELKLAGEWLKQNSNLEDRIITNSFPQISYYSERQVSTFGDGLSNPESHSGYQLTEEEFYEFVETEKPRFLILSGFQGHEDWQLSYPQRYSYIWRPVKAYPENSEQPMLVIYEANYNNPPPPPPVVESNVTAGNTSDISPT